MTLVQLILAEQARKRHVCYLVKSRVIYTSQQVRERSSATHIIQQVNHELELAMSWWVEVECVLNVIIKVSEVACKNDSN